jgi:hypothetical protein
MENYLGFGVLHVELPEEGFSMLKSLSHMAEPQALWSNP